MRSATNITVATFGTLAALVGFEQGIGEIVQGNTAPADLVIMSWPDPKAMRILGGEPVLTIVPNLLLSGMLTSVVSLIFMVWATVGVQRTHGGLVLIFLSLVVLLVGGGFGPPLLGLILGLAVTKVNAPFTWWRAHLSAGARHILGAAWVWLLAAALIAWLLVMPGSILLDDVLRVNIPDAMMFTLILGAFALLLLAIVAAFAHDGEQRAGVQHAPTLIG